MYWVYILRLANGSYYTGYTADLAARYREHLRGKGSKITRSFPPVSVAGCWRLSGGRGDALKVEAWIKSRGRRVKQTLVDRPELLARLLGEEAGFTVQLEAWDPGRLGRQKRY